MGNTVGCEDSSATLFCAGDGDNEVLCGGDYSPVSCEDAPPGKGSAPPPPSLAASDPSSKAL